jgi:alanine racemase
VPVASTLAKAGADWLGVASTEEGIELRESGLSLPILVMGGIFEPELEALVAHQLSPVVYHPETLSILEDAAAKSGRPIKIHVKVDTGMGRLGFSPDSSSRPSNGTGCS